MIPALAIAALAVFFVFGVLLGWRRAGRAVLITLAIFVTVFLLGRFVGLRVAGYDYFFYVMAAYLICLPGVAGLLGGALIGWLAQRHKGN